MKSQYPHKYGPLNVATAVGSGLGVRLSSSFVAGCAPGPEIQIQTAAIHNTSTDSLPRCGGW